jgi:putative phosphoesterase
MNLTIWRTFRRQTNRWSPDSTGGRLAAVTTSDAIPRLAARRVAVLSDVHGNATALSRVLDELTGIPHDLVVFGGDLTWGPQPLETLALVDALAVPKVFIRGNAERAVIEVASGIAAAETRERTPRELWLAEMHSSDDVAFLAGFAEQAIVDIEGFAAVRFCHGSPRGDEECITPETPPERIDALMAGVEERVLVSAHTHLQFDREVAGVRSINPGSVGMPYCEGPTAAYWALLAADGVDLRRTPYDLDAASRAYRATTDPLREKMVELLIEPIRPDVVIADAEERVFAG